MLLLSSWPAFLPLPTHKWRSRVHNHQCHLRGAGNCGVVSHGIASVMFSGESDARGSIRACFYGPVGLLSSLAYQMRFYKVVLPISSLPSESGKRQAEESSRNKLAGAVASAGPFSAAGAAMASTNLGGWGKKFSSGNSPKNQSCTYKLGRVLDTLFKGRKFGPCPRQLFFLHNFITITFNNITYTFLSMIIC